VEKNRQNEHDSTDTTAASLHFTRTNGPVDRAIEGLIQMAGGIRQPDIVREMMLAALKAGQENQGRAELKLMNSSLKEMRYSAKVFAPYRNAKKVAIFGSARTRPENPLYEMARRLGGLLAQSGYMIITGGGPGIMQAANEGAGPESSFGINIRLPLEQKPNPVLEGNPRHITYKYFFSRKVTFIKEAHAAVLFPGGFGTLDETLETMTLVQTGKRNAMPLILIDRPGGTYWRHCLTFFEQELLARGYIDQSDLRLWSLTQDVAEAVAEIDRFYSRLHSLRYVGPKLVLRLNSPILRSHLEELKRSFADLLLPQGDIRLAAALEEESDEPDIAHLARLVIDFNRRNPGRLRELIDTVNLI